MFRRRPFRRRPPLSRRLGTRPLLPPRVRRGLARAHDLLAARQFVEAAQIFERFFEEAQRRGMPIRAAELALQASRARFAGDEIEAALEWARRALQLFVRGGRFGRVSVVLTRMSAALRDRSYDAQADDLEQEVARMLEAEGVSLEEARQQAPRPPETHGTLPARCTGCGAPLIPDEVEWHDPHTAVCLYCGVVVKASP